MSPEREARLESIRKLEELAELAYAIQSRVQDGELSMSGDEVEWLQTVAAVSQELANSGRFTLEGYLKVQALANLANRSLVDGG